MSPNGLFVAYKNRGLLDGLLAMGGRYLTARVNNIVCRQAERFIWGVGNEMRDFVDRRLSRDAEARRRAAYFK
jgi:hypothetical protein